MNKNFSISKKISAFICANLWLIFLCLSINAQTPAPGAPGKDAQWATAGKQAIGTSASLESKVWFTLAQGVMTEVYYPNVTTANVHLLQFVVVNPKTRKVETEQTDAIHEIKVLRPDSLTFQQINTAKSGEWKITKTYITDNKRDTILIDVKFEPKNRNLNLYVYYNPSLANSGMHDSATQKVLSDGEVFSALYISTGTEEKTNGFYQVTDGLEQLRKFGKINTRYDEAKDGNVVQMAKIKNPKNFVAALNFSTNQNAAFIQSIFGGAGNFKEKQIEYEKGWSDYVKTLRKVEPKYQAQFNMAAMILKAYEDKTVRGANIASLTIPWGGGENANENTIGGYHLVWSRDLYQVATAFMALGNMEAANRALDFVFNVQQKEDGSVPQNSKLDGTPFWGSLQLDEVAFPLILAYQLKRFDKKTWKNHVKKAADFIVKNGPKTPQERWEEEGGFSPSTIAAEIAGLVCAAEIARKNDDNESANRYLKTADEWQANVEKWTVTTNGKLSKSPYYVRITQNGTPNAGDKIELNNGAGTFDEREIVDAGFLELVRLGIKSPDDPIIQNSLKVIDENIRVQTPNGAAFYRYNHDGYGEMDDGRRWNFDGKYTGKGRLWALLSGERGQYELALADFYKSKLDTYLKENPNVFVDTNENIVNKRRTAPALRLEAMAKFANEGLMIPEQIWDSPNVPKNVDKQFVPELKFGEGTGSATPLAWSMAQFIRLAVNLQEGRNTDTPDVVYERYVLNKKDTYSNIGTFTPSPVKEEKTKGTFIKENESFNTDSKTGESIQQKNIQTLPFSCEQSFKILNLALLQGMPKFSAKNWKPSKVPLISDMGKVSFFYKGENDVEVVGDFTSWKAQGFKMKEVQDTDWKCVDIDFAPTARVEYKLIVDGKWITDPLNSNKIDNGVGGENSFFTMPDYQPTVWANADNQAKPALDIRKINSKIYGEREIKIYVPENFSNRALPVMYLQDGTDYIRRADAITIERNLVKVGKIKPFIMVFIDYKDRMKEYWAADEYAKFIAEEVVPFLDRNYKTIKSRHGRAIMGASLGGITSFHTAIKYPEIFARIGGQSSSFWIDDERVVKEIENLDSAKNKFTFYIDDGTLEGVEDSRAVVKILRDKGFGVTYIESEAGHNWTAWRDRLADAFIALWK